MDSDEPTEHFGSITEGALTRFQKHNGLNADGQLVGINFDRCWEGTMSDIEYDPDQCRNITLDIRYCLFIIDKFAGAQRLIDEMTIVD